MLAASVAEPFDWSCTDAWGYGVRSSVVCCSEGDCELAFMARGDKIEQPRLKVRGDAPRKACPRQGDHGG
jgi:hypothetical protein